MIKFEPQQRDETMRIRTLLAGRSERYKVREMKEKQTRNALRDKSKKSAIETPVLSSSLLSSSSLEYAAFFVSLLSKRRDLKLIPKP